ncbi:MAG: hypothetical protein DRI90_27780 [Deltaproteobacteria bacterium]|nr:MAG: hypothetical protein DRI90_27780 [Deltaproteobacteria bacterium]
MVGGEVTPLTSQTAKLLGLPGVHSRATFPARPFLVAAVNPCPLGESAQRRACPRPWW